MVIRRRSIFPLRAALRQGRSAWGFAEAPAALMGSVFVVAPDPLVEILLQLGDRTVDALAERHPVELVQHCFCGSARRFHWFAGSWSWFGSGPHPRPRDRARTRGARGFRNIPCLGRSARGTA